MPPDAVAEARERIRLRLQESVERIADVPCPVYRDARPGTPELIGSAVVLEINDVRFLCTAAHVLRNRDSRDIYLPDGPDLRPFGGVAIGSDESDFRLFKLEDADANRFKRYTSVKMTGVDQDDVPRQGHQYAFVGFPASRNKSRRGDTRIQPRVTSFTAVPLGNEAYSRYGFAWQTHLLVDFDKKRAVAPAGGIVQPVDPHGLSGGPVFRLGDLGELDRGTNVEKLVAIAVECRRDALVAVRISLILQTLRQVFPDMAEAIPKARYLGVNVTSRE